MLDYFEIGQRIRKYRKALGLSQEELAEKVDISTTHMSHIETGNTKLSLGVLVDISLSLDIGTDELLFGSTQIVRNSISDDILLMLGECTGPQLLVIRDIVYATKKAMDSHIKNP